MKWLFTNIFWKSIDCFCWLPMKFTSHQQQQQQLSYSLQISFSLLILSVETRSSVCPTDYNNIIMCISTSLIIYHKLMYNGSCRHLNETCLSIWWSGNVDTVCTRTPTKLLDGFNPNNNNRKMQSLSHNCQQQLLPLFISCRALDCLLGQSLTSAGFCPHADI